MAGVQQCEDLVLFVVEQRDAEACLKLRLETDIQHQVDRIDTALAREVGQVVLVQFGMSRIVGYPAPCPSIRESAPRASSNPLFEGVAEFRVGIDSHLAVEI